MKIRSEQQPCRWGEGFPLGNGHMGAMVLTSLPKGSIELSENTFYSGEKSMQNNQPGAAEAFYEMREYAKKEDYEKVHMAAEKFVGVRGNYGTNLPVGHLSIDYGIDPEEVSHYERSLDITDGTAVCTFRTGRQALREEVFISHPGQVLVYHLNLEGGSRIRIAFAPGNSFGSVRYEGGSMEFVCHAYEEMHCDELCGVMLAGSGVVRTDGACSADEDGISISGAEDIWLYVHMKTDFKRQFRTAEEGRMELREEARKHAAACADQDAAEIRRAHQKDVRSLMDRVKLRLTGQDFLVGRIPSLFQYGRYLLLSSSRADSLLPAHLQGIWNDNVACRIGWTCDMHLDINTQMNYWPAEPANLSETAEPLFGWIKEDLSESGKETAERSYGLDGWVGELVSNAWGYAAPYWASPIAPCPTGGVWVLMQMWEHYLFSEDDGFLRHRAFPLIESAARFFSRYVFEEEDTGWLTSGPSISPENSFLSGDKAFQISNGCTYEILMIRELFSVYRQACKVLKRDNTLFYQEISGQLKRLLPYRITKEGELAEWSHDLPPADAQHRHTSHLLGLFPFSQLNPEETPELCEAAKETLRRKQMPAENWEDTGWARSLLILYAARLGDGNDAYGHIRSMIGNLLEPNDLVYHPPTRGAFAFDHVYELDGNTGLTAAVAEMLLQSHKGIIRLLPALPDAWEAGEVEGLFARGNITVDMSWEKGRLKNARLTAKREQDCSVVYGNQHWIVHLKANVPFGLYPDMDNL
ncbi:glycosyl hydrolase family 95 catalytic domain-containing protein [Anaerobium acetethylicum]|uniref:glycosyl hydrolase family 95 catalytic domain-containing protein n=1 Tax=Anaerobium acetethylicum TaxID=1619234 RepID=UPI0014725602|nr:glycoside hydrolase N-terminal domain-containing protein [Anaerobium acetethylicum]